METERLILRKYKKEDFDDLCQILSDKETMKFYPKPYDKEMVKKWIEWNLENYKTFGFGLWALILKENGKFIGDCGITMQRINGKIRPEIGYHLNKNYHNQGYGTEAARKCRDFIFLNTTFMEVYSYMTKDNIASSRIAEKNGMKLVEEYFDEEDGILKVYCITRNEWEELSSTK